MTKILDISRIENERLLKAFAWLLHFGSLALFTVIAFPSPGVFLLSAYAVSIIYWLINRKAQGKATFIPLFISSLILLINLPYYLSDKGPALNESTILLFFSLASLFAIKKVESQAVSFESRNADRLFSISLLVYIIIFFAIAYYRFSIFSDWMANMAHFNQSFYMTLKGTFFYNAASWIGWKSHFATHNSPFLILLLPFYAIIPGALTLIFLHIAILSSAAIPIYVIAREKLNSVSAYFMAMGFLLLPTIISKHLYPFSTRVLGIGFLIWMIYYFEKKDFKKFMVFSALFLSVIETFALIFSAFSLYAYIKKMDRKWIITPLILGILWFAFSIYVVIPYFASIGSSEAAFPKNQFVSYYGHLGDKPSEVLKTMIFEPMKVVKLLADANKLGFLYHMISPYGLLLPLLSPVMLIGIPDVILNFLSKDPGTYSPYPSYNLALAALLTISSIYSLSRLSINERFKSLNLKTFMVPFIIMLLIISNFHVWYKPRDFLAPKELGSLRKINETTKKDAKVLILTQPTSGIEAVLSDKAIIYLAYSAHQVNNPDLVIINTNVKDESFGDELSRKWISQYEKRQDYSEIIKDGPYRVLRFGR